MADIIAEIITFILVFSGLFSVLAGIIALILFMGLKVVQEYERGVKLRFGRYVGMMNPGLRLVIPMVEKWFRVDMRVVVVDVPPQETLTKDNISVKVNAVLYYKVVDASKAILEVEHYNYALSQLSQTTMRDVVGTVELDTLLSQRDKISDRIKELIDAEANTWGVDVHNVELKHIDLPDTMIRTMAKQAEAEREKRAVIIKADGERIAAENLVKAAKKLAETKGGLHLRTLHTLNDLSSDKSQTIVFAMPVELLKALARMGEKGETIVKIAKK